jgi:hypothetical protein
VAAACPNGIPTLLGVGMDPIGAADFCSKWLLEELTEPVETLFFCRLDGALRQRV